MIPSLRWKSIGIDHISKIYIYVSKDKVVVSENPLINEPSLKTYNIPQYFRGKKYIYG